MHFDKNIRIAREVNCGKMKVLGVLCPEQMNFGDAVME